ncbi:MAG: ABC transporter permease subunit [Planctomycetota bacterium]
MPPTRDVELEAAPPADDRTFRGSARVQAADRAAAVIISAGGLSVIAAVVGICFYLVYVTVPLLAPGGADAGEPIAADFAVSDHAPLLDEYLHTAAWIGEDASIEHRLLSEGVIIGSSPFPFAEEDGETFRTIAADPVSGFLVAQSDSTLAWASARYRYSIVTGENAPSHAGRLPDDRFRVSELEYETVGSAAIDRAIVDADVIDGRRRRVIAAIDEAGELLLWSVRKSRSLIGGGGEQDAVALDTAAIEALDNAARVILLADNQCVVLGGDGTFLRIAIGRADAVETERGRLWDGSEQLSAATTLIGDRTIVAATDAGTIGSWWVGFDPLDPEDPGRMVSGPALSRSGDSVTSLTTSHRERVVLVGDASGGVRVLHASSGKQVAAIDVGTSVQTVAVAPKTDGFVVATQDGYTVGSVRLGHPDVTPRSLFSPMLFEGQLQTQYVYQASGATDAAEPKLSLVPLIFGTIKATVVSMLFATPIAVLAAIYTSEFLSKRVRGVVKPMIETMASLPSVVLGFVAAMVVAPFVAEHLSVVLASFVVVPLLVLVISGLSGFRAGSSNETHGSAALPMYVVLVAAAGIGLSIALANPFERVLFGPDRADVLTLAGSVEPTADGLGTSPVEPATDETQARVDDLAEEFAQPSVAVKNWLSGVYGAAGPGWFALIAPAMAVLCILVVWPLATARSSRIRDAAWEPIARIATSCMFGIVAGGLAAVLLASADIDPRESIVGAFTQRNTLVIGIVMGFAIIPIIYTISDDAIQSVPASLRAASLGAGATRWQTTVRVVLPVAASGIFSASMIGLGRAVGETMIVLMATGNTPIMDWNVFEGLRTLSANIAVELPEAERGGTHYRLLFLCGVVLFVMTFVVNTTAEIVRQRFRKRNSML